MDHRGKEAEKNGGNVPEQYTPLIRAADVPIQEDQWVWNQYIAKGEVTLVEGDPGTGKSIFLLAVAATLSTGDALPGQEPRHPQNTMYLGTEDPPKRIRARLETLQADLTRIAIIPEHGWDWHIGRRTVLEKVIRGTGASLVVIDPVFDFWPPGVDSYRQETVRPVISGLVDVARSTDCAIVLVRHWTKSAETPGKYRGVGSVGFSARARCIIAITHAGLRDGKQYRAYKVVKSNITDAPPTRYFSWTNGQWHWSDTIPARFPRTPASISEVFAKSPHIPDTDDVVTLLHNTTRQSRKTD